MVQSSEEPKKDMPAKPEEKDVIQISTQTLKIIGITIASIIILIALIAIIKGRKKKDYMND